LLDRRPQKQYLRLYLRMRLRLRLRRRVTGPALHRERWRR